VAENQFADEHEVLEWADSFVECLVAFISPEGYKAYKDSSTAVAGSDLNVAYVNNDAKEKTKAAEGGAAFVPSFDPEIAEKFRAGRARLAKVVSEREEELDLKGQG
jgi:hypothetical protein